MKLFRALFSGDDKTESQAHPLNPIIFKNHKVLVIENGAVATLMKYQPVRGGLEAGGVLLGYVSTAKDCVVSVTEPTRHDKRGEYEFVRSVTSAQKPINEIWKKSCGTEIYLGEWHTHNEKNPKPSQVDRQMIAGALNDTKMEIDFLYLVILGFENTIWAGKQTKSGLQELRY